MSTKFCLLVSYKHAMTYLKWHYGPEKAGEYAERCLAPLYPESPQGLCYMTGPMLLDGRRKTMRKRQADAFKERVLIVTAWEQGRAALKSDTGPSVQVYVTECPDQVAAMDVPLI